MTQLPRTRSNFNISSENSNTNNQGSSNITDKFNELIERNNRLQQDKNRKEAALEQVNIQLEECLRQAKEQFGVNSLDELIELIKKTEEEEKEKYNIIKNDLDILQDALHTVDENIRNENSL